MTVWIFPNDVKILKKVFKITTHQNTVVLFEVHTWDEDLRFLGDSEILYRDNFVDIFQVHIM